MDIFWTFVGRHWLLSALFVILVIAVFVFESIAKRKPSFAVSAEDAVQLINKEDAVVVDVRHRDAFVRGHIVNAVHLPMQELTKDLKKITEHKHKPIIVVCEQGVEATKAAKIIESNEFKTVKVLQGGLRAWQESKLPLEKGK